MSTDSKRHRSVDNEPSGEYPNKSLRRDDALDSSSLANLLDFSALTSHSDIDIQSGQLADALLCGHHVLLKHDGREHKFDILELEFYLHKSGCHEDPFAHGADEQKRYSGRWYFHRAPTRSANSDRKVTAAGGYRGGTRKGLDLTIGGPIASPYFESSNVDTSSTRIRGGILLRTLRRSSDSTVISGPSLLVDEILRLSKASNISELVEQRWGRNTIAFPQASTSGSTSTSLCLQPKAPAKQAVKPIIYRSPRVGLDLSNPCATESPTDPRVIYISKPYRYFVHPHLLTSNGRGHTFLGIYRTCLHDSVEDTLREIVRLSGLKEQTVVKYLADYKAGLQNGALHSFVGSAGKGASASPATYLKMMGTLERISAQDAHESTDYEQ